jgi:beta-mannanase
MLRSDVDQKHAEKQFTLNRIVRGDFDNDLRKWALSAKEFGSPFLIEWGTEPNGDWFAWNGKWHGRALAGPALFVKAYRHIVDVMRAAGAANLTWVWHVNWDDQPETKWNRLENYYPGNDYCDWLAASAYGPTTPRMSDETESLRYKLDQVYPRLNRLAPEKPIIVAEFGCDIHNRHGNAAAWAKAALDDFFSGHWPRLIGFCWWNEGWQNDDVAKHDSDLIITHDAALTKVFRDEFATHLPKIQESGGDEMTKHEW